MLQTSVAVEDGCSASVAVEDKCSATLALECGEWP